MKLCKKSKRKFRYVDNKKKIRQIIERQKKQYEMINIHRNIAIEIYDVELRLECMLIK